MIRHLLAVSIAQAALGLSLLTAPAAQADFQCRPKKDSRPQKELEAEALCDPSEFKFMCLKRTETCASKWSYECVKDKSECAGGAEPFALNTDGASGAKRGLAATGAGADGTAAGGAVHSMSRNTAALGTLDTGSAATGAGAASPDGYAGLLQGARDALKNTTPKSAPLVTPGDLSGIAPAKTANGASVSLQTPSPDSPLWSDPTYQQAVSVLEGANTPPDAYLAAMRAANKMVADDNSARSNANDALKRAQGGLDASDEAQSPKSRPRVNNGDCGVSADLDGKYGCGGTRNMIKANQGINMAGQIGASVTTQLQGAQAQSAALTSGTQSSVLQGAASTQMTAGQSQVALGAVNAMMGMMEMQRGRRHDGYAREITAGFETPQKYLYKTNEDSHWNSTIDGNLAQKGLGVREVNDVAQSSNGNVRQAAAVLASVKKQYEGAQARQAMDPTARAQLPVLQAEMQRRTDELNRAMNQANANVSQAGVRLAQNAADEQKVVAQESKDAGMLAMLQAAQQIGQGAMNIATAKQLSDAAAKMAATENNSGLTLQPPGQDSFPTTDPRAPTVITGTGAAPGTANPATAEQQPTDGGTPPLGSGIPQPQDNGPNGPPVPAGKFVPGAAPGGAGGGGGGVGGLAGGSTQPAGPDNAEKGPTAANPYVAGTTPVSGGMVGPPAPGAKEDRLGPADMMAAAMGLLKGPQNQEPGNAQIYGGLRGPAGQGSLNGYNLPESNLFDIVGEGIRRQVEAGNVGG